MDLVCKSCQNPISETYFFCPYCGKKLRQPPQSTSIGKQIGVYLFAIFFPFLTIVPGVRYINQPDNKSKAVGVVTLFLTGISILVNVYVLIYINDNYLKPLMNNPLSIIDGSIPIDSGLMETLKGIR